MLFCLDILNIYTQLFQFIDENCPKHYEKCVYNNEHI